MLRKKTPYNKIENKSSASLREITKFNKAIANAKVEHVRKFVAKYGADKETMNFNDFLHEACLGASYTTQDAIFLRQVEIVKILLSSTAIDVNKLKSTQQSALDVAAKSNQGGKTTILTLLLDDERVDKNRYHDGKTALHLAVSLKRTANVAALIANEAVDINAKTKISSRTALHIAADEDNLPIVNILLNRKDIDINLRDKNGSTPTHLALITSKKSVIANNLIQRADFETNAQDSQGRTALHIAIEKDSAAAFNLLLAKQNIDINLAMKTAETPLMIAIKHGRSAMIAKLLARPDINVNAKTNKGREALHYAAATNDVATLKALLSHAGIDVNVKDDSGITPLQAALALHEKEAARLLISHKNIDINTANLKGDTALTIAAMHNDALLIRLLLDHGADPSHINGEGYNARMIAADAGNFGIATLLADVTQSKKMSGSPLQQHSLLARSNNAIKHAEESSPAPTSPKL